MAKRKSKNLLKVNINRLIVFVVISLIFICTFFIFKSDFDKLINGKDILSNTSELNHDGLMVHFIDVGQADCIVIELPDNKKMLIDAGTTESADQMVDYINKNVFDEPNEEKVFDYLLLTHSDADHCGGMPRIFEEYQVNKVFRPQIYINDEDREKDDYSVSNGMIKDSKIYTSTINSMYAEPNCSVNFTVLSLMNTSQKICALTQENYYEFKFYSPNKNYYSEVNTYSPIMTLTYNDKVFMFTGDATTTSEEEALKLNLPKVDVLKVGHHGSNTSSSEKFINEIMPSYAIIQVGKDNKYDLPKEMVLSRLALVNSKVYRTDINQNIIAIVSSYGELSIFADIGNKIEVIYLLIGVELIAVYFCFFVSYKSKNKA